MILNRSESGRTMLEMLGVLGIMGILMYGAVAGINYGMTTYKINQTYNEVQEIVQGVQDLYSWSRKYPSAGMNQAICDNDIYSRECSGGVGSHQFGDTISVSPTYDGDSFKIEYKNIKAADCRRLEEMEWSEISMKACTDADTQTVTFCPRLKNAAGGDLPCDD